MFFLSLLLDPYTSLYVCLGNESIKSQLQYRRSSATTFQRNFGVYIDSIQDKHNDERTEDDLFVVGLRCR